LVPLKRKPIADQAELWFATYIDFIVRSNRFTWNIFKQ